MYTDLWKFYRNENYKLNGCNMVKERRVFNFELYSIELGDITHKYIGCLLQQFHPPKP